MGIECKAAISWTYFEYAMSVVKRTVFVPGIVGRLCMNIFQKLQWMKNVLQEKKHNAQNLNKIG
jgi:hypothetical protein